MTLLFSDLSSEFLKHKLVSLVYNWNITNTEYISLQLALNVLSHIVYRGGSVLFICTHPQFENLTQKLARDTGEYFVTRSWRGGTFTNSYMVLGTRRLPDAVVFLHLPSLGRNTLAVKETAMCNIPSIAIVDSDCNPNLITYPIPGNDDTPSAMALYAKVFKEAILKAKENRKALHFINKKKVEHKSFDATDDFY